MADLGRLDELKRKFDENPRRYFAPLANEYRKAGDPERAIELCRTYLPQQPNHMSGYIVYGQALHDGGRSDEATAVFKQALTLDPENIIALRHLGEIAEASGDKAAAMRWFGKVLELDPRNEEIAGYITALASPSATQMPQDRPVQQPQQPQQRPIRPEPEPDPAAVALADVLRQPDRPAIGRYEPRLPEPPSLPPAWSGNDADTAAQAESENDDRATRHEPVPDSNGENGEDVENEADGDASDAFQAIDWHSEAASLSTGDEASGDDDRAIGSIGPEGRIDTAAGDQREDHREMWSPPSAEHDAESQGDGGPGARALGEDEPASPEPALTVQRSPFVTETMAELYMQQGLDGEALAIYRQIAETRPDAHITDRIAELETRVEQSAEAVTSAGFGSRYDREMETEIEDPLPAHVAPASAPAAHAVGESVRDFFTRIGSAKPSAASSHADASTAPLERPRGGLDTLFGGAQNADDLMAARSLAGAFGSPQSASGA